MILTRAETDFRLVQLMHPAKDEWISLTSIKKGITHETTT
jgi:hypothetical protein